MKKLNRSMLEGPLFLNIVLYTIPIILTSILQLLFNAADLVVVGRFCGSISVAAVGATGAITNLIINLFIGLSVGANVAAARFFGAKDDQGVHEVVHTSMLLSIIGGIGVGIVGFTCSKTFLGWMDSPPDVIDQAALYMKIYFCGMPAQMIYNFGASILRAIGDTRRPLIFLTISGAVNVVLNLILVIVFHMGVAGVAIATIVSQILSATFVVICLIRAKGS